MGAEPYVESRRLTGCNRDFAAPGAALETAPGLDFDAGTLARWEDHVRQARATLGWPDGPLVVRRHAGGASLAFAAPVDQLLTATEVNEWAWWMALGRSPDPAPADAGEGESGGEGACNDEGAGAHPASLAPAQALALLRERAGRERDPALRALMAEAARREVPVLADEALVTLGAGRRGAGFPADALPTPAAVDWARLSAIPTVLVTGSNGKTTTVRLLAALCEAHGWPAAHSCTDGVFFDGVALETGDYSGPAGARTALRAPGAAAAVLETARGGLLRRGLALCRADVAVVTNISVDHFGEYGIHDLAALAHAKLTVARAVAHGGLLVANADDATLRAQVPADARRGQARLGWFALDDLDGMLAGHRAAGGDACWLEDGHLWLQSRGVREDLGAAAAMPLSLGGQARYNLANLAAAALAASGLGIPARTIAAVFARFGRAHADNPGRLQRWQVGGATVVIDYAHNPDGLQGLLDAVGAPGRSGRLAVLLGHAGNREDGDLRAVAATAAASVPDLVVLKRAEGYLRGRAADEVQAIMREALLGLGFGADRVVDEPDELQAVRRMLAWAREGDMLVLPVFDRDARARAAAMLDAMVAAGWRTGQAVPDPPA